MSKTITPGDLENEVGTTQNWYIPDIALQTPVHTFGVSRLNTFLGNNTQAQISKTMPPGDLENEVVTLKIWYILDIKITLNC